MKILFTSNVSWAMIKFRHQLLVSLIEDGHELYIVAPKDDFVKELELIGCKCVDVKLSRKGVNPIEDLILLYTFYKIYQKIQPDIIFNYSIKPIIYGSIAAKIAKIPSVAVNIGLGFTFINNSFITKISHKLYKFSLQFPQMVWFINEDDKNEFIKKGFVNVEKTLVLPSEGVDLKYFLPRQKTNKDIVFLLIARMLLDKGIEEFYKAAKIIKIKYPNIRFQLLGNVDLENPRGVEEKILQGWVQEGIIEYLGYKKDVRSYIAESSCVVLPSYREGKGMTLIEAGAMQKPLIATNVEGCKDIVIDNYNGYLCRVKDEISLANKMEKFILDDEQKRLKMGLNSIEFIKNNFDVLKVIEIYKYYLKKENDMPISDSK